VKGLHIIADLYNCQKGDLLVSSGLGGVFPQGYPVGRVIEKHLRPDQAFAEIIAEPLSELDRDREVLLVWDEDADGESDPEEAAAARAGTEADGIAETDPSTPGGQRSGRRRRRRGSGPSTPPSESE